MSGPALAQGVVNTEAATSDTTETGDAPVAQPATVWCFLARDGKAFYAPLHNYADLPASRLRLLTARFVRSVTAQQATGTPLAVAYGEAACVRSASPLLAATSLQQRMAPLLGEGVVPVVVGIY